VRFVGEPARRIAEDVLRVLRYYRFTARFDGRDGDPAARAACRAAVPLLPRLSGERVAQELRRVLVVTDPLPVLRMMAEDGVLAAIVPEATRLEGLEKLIALEPEPDALRRLAAVIGVDAGGAAGVAERLRLSSAERERLVALAPPRPIDPATGAKAQRRALYRLGPERYRDLALLVAADGGMTKPRLKKLLALTAGWKPPVFPLAGRDLTALGIPPGPRIGQLLAELRAWWEDGDFAAGRAECLKRLREITRISG